MDNYSKLLSDIDTLMQKARINMDANLFLELKSIKTQAESLLNNESTELKPARYSSGAVANWFLAKAMATKKPLTHIQLQKLMYFAHGWHLAKYDGELLVNECAEAWVYGPVFPSVHHEYKKYGSAPLPLSDRTFMMELDFSNNNIVFRRNFVSSDDHQTNEILENIWIDYVDKSGSVLSDMTHINHPNNPWKKWRNVADKLRMQNIDIDNTDIKTYFCELYNQKREKLHEPKPSQS